MRRMRIRLLDSDVLLALRDAGGPKRDRAVALPAAGRTISIQMPDQVPGYCRPKAGMGRNEAGEFPDGIRERGQAGRLTPDIHEVGRGVAERYRVDVCDAMIVAAALMHGVPASRAKTSTTASSSRAR
jgi:predicted nucleic acid-binding protein